MQLSTDSEFKKKKSSQSVAAAAASAVKIGLHPNLQALVVTQGAGEGVDGPITQ